MHQMMPQVQPRWILDTCPNLAVSSEKIHWTEALPEDVNMVSVTLSNLQYWLVDLSKASLW